MLNCLHNLFNRMSLDLLRLIFHQYTFVRFVLVLSQCGKNFISLLFTWLLQLRTVENNLFILYKPINPIFKLREPFTKNNIQVCSFKNVTLPSKCCCIHTESD